MKSYILVSLWAEDDDATQESHAFAMRLHAKRPALAVVQGEAPELASVAAVATSSPDAAIVIFCHGGSSLYSRRGGKEWADPRALAECLTGRRVYAFACDTFKLPVHDLSLSTFADRAVDACIETFVGHETTVTSPRTGVAATPTMEQALFCLIEGFIDGEDDGGALRNLGRTFGVYELSVDLDLPSEDPEQEGALSWSSAIYLQSFFNGLRSRTKPVPDATR